MGRRGNDTPTNPESTEPPTAGARAPGEPNSPDLEAHDRDWEWREMAESRANVARRWTPLFLGGAVATSVLAMAVLWGQIRPEVLGLWTVVHALTALLAGYALLGQQVPNHRTASGFSPATLVGATAMGFFWGLLLWLDTSPSQPELVQWQVGAFLLLITSMTFAYLEGAAILARYILVPAWSLFAVKLFVVGSLALGLGASAILLATTFGSLVRRRFAEERLALEAETSKSASASIWQANHDELTETLNRAGLRRALDDRLETSSHFVLLIALDHFSNVNAEFGLGIGDSVLREAAQRIRTLVDAQDLVSRVSGDEFAIVVPGRDMRAVENLATDILGRISHPMYRDAHVIETSASIGITQALGRPVDLGRALRESNHALVRARKSGRRQVMIFTRDMADKLQRRLELETGLRRAMLDDEIQVWGQPVIRQSDGTVSHVELVARWIKPDGSRVPPSVFVPLAEELGMVGDLTEHMLHGAGRALSRFAEHAWLEDAKVIVNARATESHVSSFLASVRAIMHKFEIAPESLVMEFRGSRDAPPEQLRQLLIALGRLGIGIGLDDFSMSQELVRDLQDVHGVVRLEKAVVKGVTATESQRAFAESMAQVAVELGFVPIAEGVEVEETAARLAAIGIDHIQGFLIARAMPLDRLASDQTESQIAEVTASLRATSAAVQQ